MCSVMHQKSTTPIFDQVHNQISTNLVYVCER